MAMSLEMIKLKRSTDYLVGVSMNDRGVTSQFIKSYRSSVLALLGKSAYNYLERNLDSWDGRWKVSGNFTWSKMYAESSKPVKKAPKSVDLYTKYEGKVLGAIDKVLGGWWFHLSDETQEKIHEALFRVFND